MNELDPEQLKLHGKKIVAIKRDSAGYFKKGATGIVDYACYDSPDDLMVTWDKKGLTKAAGDDDRWWAFPGEYEILED